MNAIAKIVSYGFVAILAAAAKRVGALSRAKQKGMSNADARAYSDRLYPPTKPVTGEDRFIIGLNAAAYMHWFQTREGAAPPAQATQRFIKGFLDADGFAYAADELKRIEISALASDIDTVLAFIKENSFFETLDQAAKTRSFEKSGRVPQQPPPEPAK